MKAIPFSLKAIQPILATSFQGDPNSDVSYPYIPGSMIRGALIGRYLKRHNLHNQDILIDTDIKRLFFSDNTRYLNAYLSSQEGKRTLPILLSWHKQKGDELNDHDESIEVYDFSVNRPILESPKTIEDKFWIEEKGYVRQYSIQSRINIHNTRDRSKGRSTEFEGEIFHYEAIEAGQSFQGVILCEDSDEQTIKNLLTPSDIWLGGSRSAGYGHVKITINDNNSGTEIDAKPEDRENNNILKITLLSDLIFRNEWGQYVAEAPTQLLAEALGLNKLEEKLDRSKTFMQSTYIGGFNRKWGLPLPQTIAVKAGSVFVYQNISITSAQIKQLETYGLGERKNEGFGRVAINWRLEDDQFTVKKPEEQQYNKTKQPSLITSASKKLAQEMAERILRQKLDNLIIKKLSDCKLEGKITNSQLSRLMIVARDGLTKKSRLPVFRLLRNLPSNSRKKFQQTQMSNKPFDQLIYEWIRHPLNLIKFIDTSEPLEIEIATIKQNLTLSLAIEYTLKLIIAICKKAMKEQNNE